MLSTRHVPHACFALLATAFWISCGGSDNGTSDGRGSGGSGSSSSGGQNSGGEGGEQGSAGGQANGTGGKGTGGRANGTGGGGTGGTGGTGAEGGSAGFGGGGSGEVDDDGDGLSVSEGDCDDTNAAVSPSAPEICNNSIDDDCDTVVDDVQLPTMVGPLPYLQATDSPWDPTSFETFVLADFEDKVLPTGVTASGHRWSSDFGHAIVDSVDGDDGDPTNGTCNPCEAMWAGTDITLTFDPVALGGLPTHVGLVVTDTARANVTAKLSATSVCGSLGEVSSDVVFGDSSISGETAEDRFVGIVSAAGITSVTISVGGALEIDHLQFGF